jgi:hypothetical protein
VSYCPLSAEGVASPDCANALGKVRQAAKAVSDAANHLANKKADLRAVLGVLENKLTTLQTLMRFVPNICGFEVSGIQWTPELIQDFISHPEFRRLSGLEQMQAIMSLYREAVDKRFLGLQNEVQRRQFAAEKLFFHERQMLRKIAPIELQVDYQPKDNLINKLGWRRAKKHLHDILLRSISPAIKTVQEITQNSIIYCQKLPTGTTQHITEVPHCDSETFEYELHIFTKDKIDVQIFENHYVVIPRIERGLSYVIRFDSQKDAKLFADLIMSFHKQYINSLE